ncbi:uncharacterized protein EDB91DRAFT_1181306, partial [Suillus paluster]|uniref:uncharacterized protein n=1 Tax=Suillus paluster TaxID=48578 RepID=UPI001B874B7C
MHVATEWTSVVMFAMLGVIMITRLYAMYQRSRTVVILLIVVLLAVTIANGVINEIVTRHTSGEILTTVWEVLALCLAVRIAVKHFREQRLRRSSAGGIIGDCFKVLMKSH